MLQIPRAGARRARKDFLDQRRDAIERQAATQELVVPRSMPITFDIVQNLVLLI